MKNQPKKEKRLTEDEKEKIKTAVKELMSTTEKLVEVKMPLNVIIHIVKQVYVMHGFSIMLDKLTDELKRK